MLHKFTKCYRGLSGFMAFTAGEKRVVFEVGGGETEQPAAKVEVNIAPAAKPGEEISTARATLATKMATLKASIAAAQNSNNQEIKKAAAEAQAQMNTLTGGGVELNIEQVTANLRKLTTVLAYFQSYPALAGKRAEIVTRSDALLNQIGDKYKENITDLLEQYPGLSIEAKAKLDALIDGSLGNAEVQIIARANPGTEVSFSDYQKDPSLLTTLGATVKSSLAFLSGENGDLYATLAKVNREHEHEAQAIVVADYAKDEKRAKDLVDSYCGEKIIEAAGNTDWEMRIGQLQTNATKALELLKGAGNAGARAMVLANLRIQLYEMTFPDSPSADDQEEREEFRGYFVKYVEKETGYKRNAYGKAILGGIADVKKNPNMGETKEGDIFSVMGRPNFRLEPTGTRLATLTPNTPVKLLDTDYYEFDVAKDKKVQYVRVQLDPPNGPIGFVSMNNVDWRSGVSDNEEETTPENASGGTA